ncbi:hypothetical protein HYV12_01005 [Candidatus Dojkabacteria bacterium]|nr:hypothetical protein [Candidatus Dojkabacteria bacterium]
MAPVRLTKKGIIILAVVLSLVSFGIGYGVWKVTGAPYLSSTDSEAGGSEKGGANIKKEKLEKCKCDEGGGVASCGNWCVEKDLPKEKEEKPEKVCGCTSFENGCGVNCWFPGGTSAAVKEKAKSSASCQSYIAMCAPNGMSVTYEEFKPGHRCWGKQDECKNPVGTADCSCEGGGLIGENTVSAVVGQPVEFCGYAYDKDGINKNNIVISVNGTAVGKATVTDACADPNDSICTQYKNKKPVKWCYTYTPTTEGDQNLKASWKDAEGFGGAACTATREVSTAVVQDNWIVDKNAGRSCLNNTAVRLSYTITITNSASDIKEISKIVDTLDTKVQNNYIKLESINPGGSVSGNVITWNLTGDSAKFDPSETKTFTYTVEIPASAFGTYTNQAVITPVGADSNITVNETIIASCDVPDTAIFDTVQSRIAVGIFLILVALAYVYIDPFETGVNSIFGKVSYKLSSKGRLEKNREKFEKRVVS